MSTYPAFTGESGLDDRGIVMRFSNLHNTYITALWVSLCCVTMMIKHGIVNELDVVETDTRKQLTPG